MLEKWVSLPGPLYCVRTDFGAKTQILAEESFFNQKFPPHKCVLKMIRATWGSF